MAKKVIYVLLIITLLICSTNIVQAKGSTSTTSLKDILQGGQNFIDQGEKGDSPIGDDEIKNLSNTIYNVLLIIGIVIAGIIGMVLGMQFITGSVEQKAKVKDSLIPFVVGCVVIFGAFGIWKLVVQLGANI